MMMTMIMIMIIKTLNIPAEVHSRSLKVLRRFSHYAPRIWNSSDDCQIR